MEEQDFIINLGRLSHTGIGGTSFRVWLIEILERGLITGVMKGKASVSRQCKVEALYIYVGRWSIILTVTWRM